MTMNGEYTKSEILSQPDVWQTTIKDIRAESKKISSFIEDPYTKKYVVVGCGSTYYLSLSTAYLLRKNGFDASAYPSSEFVFFLDFADLQNIVLILISRSGTTTETLWALDKARQHISGVKTITITVRPDTPLAKNSDLVLAAPAADEKSVAQTRSFTSMYICAQVFAEVLCGKGQDLAWLESLPENLRQLQKTYYNSMEAIGKDLSIERFFFLGGGPLYGLACEGMLKTKELAMTWSEAYHPLELRHGPMSVVNNQAAVVALISDKQQVAKSQVMQDMKRLGAKTIVLTENTKSADWKDMDLVVEVGSHLNENQRGTLYLPLIQWIGFNRSLAKGFILGCLQINLCFLAPDPPYQVGNWRPALR